MIDNYCGYIDYEGNFIDCSNMSGIFKHNEWCEKNDEIEEELMDTKSWVKLSESLPNHYIFTSFRPLSIHQIEWLHNHGYVIDKMDYSEDRNDWRIMK